jgi:hypothetical protein
MMKRKTEMIERLWKLATAAAEGVGVSNQGLA